MANKFRSTHVGDEPAKKLCVSFFRAILPSRYGALSTDKFSERISNALSSGWHATTLCVDCNSTNQEKCIITISNISNGSTVLSEATVKELLAKKFWPSPKYSAADRSYLAKAICVEYVCPEKN